MTKTTSAASPVIRLTLPLPPSVNHLFATVRGRRIKSAEGRRYSDSVAQAALQARCKPFEGNVGVRMWIYRRRKAGDLDNYSKALFDCLKGACWKDDKQIIYIESHRDDDPKNPRVEIEVWEIPDVPEAPSPDYETGSPMLRERIKAKQAEGKGQAQILREITIENREKQQPLIQEDGIRKGGIINGRPTVPRPKPKGLGRR